MKICNTCHIERDDTEYTKTDHGQPGVISSHKRCKVCDRSRSHIFNSAAVKAGFKGRSDKAWFAITRGERASIISDFFDHLRYNKHPVTDKIDPDFAAAHGFLGFDGTIAPIARIPRVSKLSRPAKPKKFSGPVLKAMPRGSSKMVFADSRLDEVRQLHQRELVGKINEQVTLRVGFVYVIRNPAWPEALKIGSALDYEARLNSYQTGDPHRLYELVFVEMFDDRKVAENAVHHLLIDKRMTGEWFSVSAEEAVAAILGIKNGNPVATSVAVIDDEEFFRFG